MEQLKERQAALLAKAPFAPAEGKPDFRKDFKCPQTFSEREFFNTVFNSGEGLEKEMEEARKQELADWKAKVVVGNPHFKVDTLTIKKPSQLDKKEGILRDEPKKLGLRLSNSRLKEIAARQIMITKTVECPPSTMFADEAFVDPLKRQPALKTKDPALMTGGRDFNTNIRNDVLSYSPKSTKVFIQPMAPEEKQGPKWHH